ncbi:uncharacterized protein LOC112452542 [Temnothorax curvispinosus]|uniref:Uncharacterized protein LOC112452542 n=1 Tax=Temnothorax curvispinosus TaxID=300111 RepID=A0A6J1PGM2_9HYME|nr:uncharacterized protein LOC112452542 [Temnothorax curvispinosus]
MPHSKHRIRNLQQEDNCIGRLLASDSSRLAVVRVKHLARHGQCRFVVGSTTVHPAFSFAIAPRFRQLHLKKELESSSLRCRNTFNMEKKEIYCSILRKRDKGKAL